MEAVGYSNQTLSLVLTVLFLCAILFAAGLIARSTSHRALRVLTFMAALCTLLFITGALMFETGIMLNWMCGDMTHAWQAGLLVFGVNLFFAGVVWSFVLGIIFWRYGGRE